MKKSRHLLFFAFFILIGTISGFYLHNINKNKKIVEILETEAYSYLSSEAKEYVKEVYENTGEIILTEKNKEENVPYLNPKYVEYISSNEEEKRSMGNIPPTYAVDYIESEGAGSSDLPESFDLRKVNGTSSYISPIKDQGDLDLCWDFTSIEQIESKVMLNKGIPYSSSSTIFSTRQLDYASSTNGILDYNNENGTRELTSGGNFLTSTLIFYNGLGLTRESVMPFNESTDKKELYSVLNYTNSMYELNNSVLMTPVLATTTSDALKAQVNTVKQFVMDNGGAYIGTQGPGYSCSSMNSDGNQIIRVDSFCTQNAGHAMQIIGWDDNYSYSYCKSNSTHSSNVSTCSSSNLVTGKGAWIVRNSWGNVYPYVYVAYDSIGDDIYVYTSISSMTGRSWDNNYHVPVDSFVIYYVTSDTQSFTKNIDTAEKVEKVKFFSYGKGGTYTVSIRSNNEEYNDIKTVTVPYPGVYTIDLSDKNIVITDKSFDVEVRTTNRVYLLKNSTSVFTSNVERTASISNTTKSIKLQTITSDYSTRLYAYTKNIASSKTISYTLLDSNGGNASNYLTISSPNVAKNDVNTLLTFKSSIPNGYYTLLVSYQGASEEIPVQIGEAPSHTITYYSNDALNRKKTQTVEEGTAFNLDSNTFVREGYTFTSWNTQANGKGEYYAENKSIDNLTSNLNLYAQWNANSYSIRFVSNGGTGEMSNQTFVYDYEQSLRQNVFVREGYTFIGWNTKQNGTGVSYSDKEVVKNLVSANNVVLPLYAQWKKDVAYEINHYEVDYDNGRIDRIEDEITKEKFLKNIDLGEEYRVEIDLGTNSYIYTGSITKIYKGDTLVDEYVNIVRGDVNGDGKINSADLMKIVKHLVGTSPLNEMLQIAADCTFDGNINSADLMKIVKYLKGTGSIL